jgi:hypothetical protein
MCIAVSGKHLSLLKEAKKFINKHKESNTKIGNLRYMAVEDKASGTTLIQTFQKQHYRLERSSEIQTS